MNDELRRECVEVIGELLDYLESEFMGLEALAGER